MQVELWPEYDQPSMLVINYIILSPDTTLPAALTLHIPATAGKPSVVAVGQTLDSVTDQGIQYTTSTQGNWIAVNIEATGPAIQLEYYDPNLQRKDKERDYLYEWRGDYQVESFSLFLQRPLSATNIQTSPSLSLSEKRDDGLTYYSSDFGSLAAGNTFSLSLSYDRSTDALTFSSLPVRPSQPIGPSTESSFMSSFSNDLPYVLGGFGLLLIGGGVFYFLQPGRGRIKSRRKRSTRTETEGDSEVYCHQCGTRAHKGDRFCRVCGTKLRREA
ncbi:MAG: zinc ribbon domain-containing protein [Anaerolineales bacterium]